MRSPQSDDIIVGAITALLIGGFWWVQCWVLGLFWGTILTAFIAASYYIFD